MFWCDAVVGQFFMVRGGEGDVVRCGCVALYRDFECDVIEFFYGYHLWHLFVVDGVFEKQIGATTRDCPYNESFIECVLALLILMRPDTRLSGFLI